MIGTTLNQRFLLEKELGRGGMGAVYSAHDQLLDRRVAIKVLKEQSGEEVGKKLRLEAQIAARLLHENVLRIYDFGLADSAYFLVMEEVNGTSYSKRWRHLALAERLNVLALVADATDIAATEAADDKKLEQWAPTIARIGTHNAYHTGQIIYVRKLQGSWDPAKGVK